MRLLGHLYLYLVAYTSRIQLVSNSDEAIEYFKQGKPIVYTFWYQKILFFIYYFRRKKFSILIMPKTKADFLTALSTKFGHQVAQSSLDCGGRHALIALTESLKNGRSALIPADSPWGIEKKCKASSVFVAQETQSYIIPMTWSSKFAIKIPGKLNQMTLPLPFSKVEIRFGKPLLFQKLQHQQTEDIEKCKNLLSSELESISK